MGERVREIRRGECAWEESEGEEWEEDGDEEGDESEIDWEKEDGEQVDQERKEGWWRDRERLERGEVDRNGDRVKRRRRGRGELVGR